MFRGPGFLWFRSFVCFLFVLCTYFEYCVWRLCCVSHCSVPRSSLVALPSKPCRKKVLENTPIEVCMAFLFLDSLSLAATSGNLNYLAHCISGRGNSVPRCCVGQDKLCLSLSVSFKYLVLAVKTWCGGAVTCFFNYRCLRNKKKAKTF